MIAGNEAGKTIMIFINIDALTFSNNSFSELHVGSA